MPLILVGGGSRSGKSRHALALAKARGSRLGFIATAEALDDEMRDRIQKHQVERGPEFITIEEPLELEQAIRNRASEFDAVIVDCLTLWVSNLLMQESPPADLRPCYEALACTAADSSADVILVTNEVGCGIVPENALARRFRDEAGRLNQIAAAKAEKVIWMVFGIPLQVK